ncbi:flagellar biosynthesis protein FliT [Pectobacterium carotovorum subsp. carotovorum PCC21]|nr:flagellar biosynthesis protein FliT [Pectobacterium carotovorum subsp. carotovorum PCC21]
MASPHRLLKDYQQLLSLSQKILHLAVSGQWDTLVEQEIVYVQSVEGLVNTPIPDEIDSVMRLHLRQILQEVMDNEAKVKQTSAEADGRVKFVNGAITEAKVN